MNKAKENDGNLDRIICPCASCRNLSHQHCDVVYEHLVMNGMDPTYTTWFLHGEPLSAFVRHEDVEIPEETVSKLKKDLHWLTSNKDEINLIEILSF